MGVKDKVSDGASTVTHRPVVAHVLRMVKHYGETKGNQHAGAVTYFAFLSFFPLLALALFAVGIISNVYPEANTQLTNGLDTLFPDLLGEEEGQISLDTVRTFSGLTAVIGLVGVLYTGSGFILALREALMAIFERPPSTKNFLMTKISDIGAMLTIGGTLLLSVAVGSLVSRFSAGLLGLVGLGDELAWVLSTLAIVVALGINALLFFLMFRQLAQPVAPTRTLWSGALLGALGFELLKQFASQLLALTKDSPAFQAFGIALILIVWINYFARLTFFAASWAHTSDAAIAARPTADSDPVQGPQLPNLGVMTRAGEPASVAKRSRASRWATPFAAGGAVMLALVAALKKKDR